MKSKLLIISALFMASLYSCTSDVDCVTDTPSQNENENGVVEAARCDGTVLLTVNNPKSRASNIDGTIDRFTASSVLLESPRNYAVVTYQGRNKEEIGMVQILDLDNNNAVVSELSTENARVNIAEYRYEDGIETLYIGVDRSEGNYPVCGIITVNLDNGLFPETLHYAEVSPYKVNGVSLNCIEYDGASNTHLLYAAAGGNEALGIAYKDSGFAKFTIDSTDPSILNQVASWYVIDFRGYWITMKDVSKGGMAAYAARGNFTKSDGTANIYWRAGAISPSTGLAFQNTDNYFMDQTVANGDTDTYTQQEVYSIDGERYDYGRFSVSTFMLDGYNYVLSNVGHKDAGIQLFRCYTSNGWYWMSKQDTYYKACHHTTDLYTDTEGNHYIFAACSSDGVYKIRIEHGQYSQTIDGTSVPMLKMVPECKYNSHYATESGTNSSSNYVLLSGDKVYVANGYEGLVVLDVNDTRFVACD